MEPSTAALLTLVDARNGALHPAVQVAQSTHAGRSLKTNSTLSADSTVLEVPAELILTEAAAAACLKSHGVAPQADWLPAGHICAALATVRSCKLPECSICPKFRAYASILDAAPTTWLHCPREAAALCWSFLLGTPLGLRIEASRRLIQADCAAVATLLGSSSVTATDVAWAHSHYVSRAMRVPMPVSALTAPPVGAVASALPQKRRTFVPFGAPACPAADERHSAAPLAKRAHIPFGGPASVSAGLVSSHSIASTLVPAMVPLADFANHRAGALTHFELRTRGTLHSRLRLSLAHARSATPAEASTRVAAGHQGCDDNDAAGKTVVALVIDRAISVAAPTSGGAGGAGTDASAGAGAGAEACSEAEIFISYGAKSNAELIVHYGFALEGNAVDALPVLLAQSDAEVEAEHADGKHTSSTVTGKEDEAARTYNCDALACPCNILRRLRLTVASDHVSDARLLRSRAEDASVAFAIDSSATAATAASGLSSGHASSPAVLAIAAPAPAAVAPRFLLTQHTPCTELLELVAQRLGLATKPLPNQATTKPGTGGHGDSDWQSALRAAMEADAASTISTSAALKRDPMIDEFVRRFPATVTDVGMSSSSCHTAHIAQSSSAEGSVGTEVSDAGESARVTSTSSSSHRAALTLMSESSRPTGLCGSGWQMGVCVGPDGDAIVRWAARQLRSLEAQLRVEASASASADAPRTAAPEAAPGPRDLLPRPAAAASSAVAALQAMTQTYREGLRAAVAAQLRFMGCE